MTEGTVVIALRGKEKGRPMAVIRVLSERCVLVADGRHRLIEKPKKKNILHLQPTNTNIGEITTNRQLRDFLASFRQGG